MNNSRINLLKKYINEEPDDPFHVYALALEYLNHDPNKSLVYFKKLLKKFPNYLPTYYQAGMLYYNLNNLRMARKLFKGGIIIAKLQSNRFIQNELQSVLDNLDSNG